jgi:hypothetical protein
VKGSSAAWLTKPRATSALESESMYTDARAEVSFIVWALAPCKVKCSVVSAVSNCAGSGGELITAV